MLYDYDDYKRNSSLLKNYFTFSYLWIEYFNLLLSWKKFFKYYIPFVYSVNKAGFLVIIFNSLKRDYSFI